MLKTIVDSILVPALRAINNWARRRLFVSLILATLFPLASLTASALVQLGAPPELWFPLLLVPAGSRWLEPPLGRAMRWYINRAVDAAELGLPPHPSVRLLPISAGLLLAIAVGTLVADLPSQLACAALLLAAVICLLWRAPSAQAAWLTLLPEAAELPPVFTSSFAPPTRPTLDPPPAR
jgi:hypothetical protein